ncbi:MAG: GIY-YIG nuclease family protein [Candidatus Liptonbacteria bacterium]|nr:GIY-YIG nuclease family protein [Candidatus Liptonbacteria bacterium]
MQHTYYVYIMTNKPYGVLYVGITGDIVTRASQHKQSLVDGFAKKYKLNKLVYYEAYDNPYDAIQREKRVKEWHRAWKIELIQRENPGWKNLGDEF